MVTQKASYGAGGAAAAALSQAVTLDGMADGRALKAESDNATKNQTANAAKIDLLVERVSSLHKTLDSVDRMARLMEQGYHLCGIIYCELNRTCCGDSTASLCCDPTAKCCGKPGAQICCAAGNTCCSNGVCAVSPDSCHITSTFSETLSTNRRVLMDGAPFAPIDSAPNATKTKVAELVAKALVA